MALANASLILSKYIEEKRPEYSALRVDDAREIFSPLKAYRSGYTLDYFEGIKGFGSMQYSEWTGPITSRGFHDAEERNQSRAAKKTQIIREINRQSVALRQEVARMRINGLHEIEFQLKSLLMRNNQQVFDIDSAHVETIESCITKFFLSASPEEKNVVSSCMFLRRILASGGSSGAAGWHVWAEDGHSPDSILFPPLTISSSVLESLLRPAKSSSLSVYKTTKKPVGWNFMEFDLVGSSNNGRIFVAHRWNANTGDASGFKGQGDLWIVLIVDEQPHQGAQPGGFTEKHRNAIEDKFRQWKSFGLKNPFL